MNQDDDSKLLLCRKLKCLKECNKSGLFPQHCDDIRAYS